LHRKGCINKSLRQGTIADVTAANNPFGITAAKHFLLEVGNIRGMKTIKCKKKMVAQPSHATKEKKESGSLAATKIEYDIHHL
jgi:hypothetical protein